ncbi:hypothetical protein HDU67_006942, partial [Dinochytrium kinnereticum]
YAQRDPIECQNLPQLTTTTTTPFSLQTQPPTIFSVSPETTQLPTLATWIGLGVVGILMIVGALLWYLFRHKLWPLRDDPPYPPPPQLIQLVILPPQGQMQDKSPLPLYQPPPWNDAREDARARGREEARVREEAEVRAAVSAVQEFEDGQRRREVEAKQEEEEEVPMDVVGAFDPSACVPTEETADPFVDAGESPK